MLGLLGRHSFAAICLAVFVEELGIPMPIPSDLLILFAGVAAAHSLTRLGLSYLSISLASALGSSVLYLIVRRGGCPLVERFGRYVHLGPKQLSRAEQFLNRTGWLGLALGRAIPGLRYGTVIMAGLLDVPYRRYLTAHLVGSSVYILSLLGLGALFGPTIAEHLHLPRAVLRLLWTGILAIGLPLLTLALGARHAVERISPDSRWQRLGALVLASFAGTAALAASWALAATLADLLGSTATLNLSYRLAGWLLGRGLQPTSAYTLIYTSLLGLCVGLGTTYDLLVIPRLAPRGTTHLRATLGLVVLGGALLGSLIVSALLIAPNSLLVQWWRSGGVVLGGTLLLGLLSYACTTVYGREVVLAVVPGWRRTRLQSDHPQTPQGRRQAVHGG